MWYGKCLVYACYSKYDKEKWPWLEMSDQIFLIQVFVQCAVHQNETGMWTVKRLFLLYHWYIHYQMLQEMIIFDWYTSFIWLSGMCIATFFAVQCFYMVCFSGQIVLAQLNEVLFYWKGYSNFWQSKFQKVLWNNVYKFDIWYWLVK